MLTIRIDVREIQTLPNLVVLESAIHLVLWADKRSSNVSSNNFLNDSFPGGDERIEGRRQRAEKTKQRKKEEEHLRDLEMR